MNRLIELHQKAAQVLALIQLAQDRKKYLRERKERAYTVVTDWKQYYQDKIEIIEAAIKRLRLRYFNLMLKIND